MVEQLVVVLFHKKPRLAQSLLKTLELGERTFRFDIQMTTDCQESFALLLLPQLYQTFYPAIQDVQGRRVPGQNFVLIAHQNQLTDSPSFQHQTNLD